MLKMLGEQADNMKETASVEQLASYAVVKEFTLVGALKYDLSLGDWLRVQGYQKKLRAISRWLGVDAGLCLFDDSSSWWAGGFDIYFRTSAKHPRMIGHLYYYVTRKTIIEVDHRNGHKSMLDLSKRS